MLKSSAHKTGILPRTAHLCLFLVFILSPSGDSYAEILANHNKRGLRAYTIEGVLRLHEEEIDLGTAALILSRDWGTNKTSHVYRRKIDDMAEEILKRMKKEHVPTDYHAIPAINAYLFDELGFATVDNADNPDDLFLHIVLEKKQGYCLSLSVLYLAIAERLGLQMYGVVVPGHFFVRYDDGHKRYNIETTSNGAIAPDEHYTEQFKPPKQLKTLYMKNLTKKQTLGCFFNNLGNCYLAVGDTQKAFEILTSAVEINPLLSEAHMNLGNIYLQKEMFPEAINKYEQALSILGRDANAFNNLGTAYMQIGEYGKAESCYKTAQSINPENVDTYRNLARALYMQDNDQAAIAQLRGALALNRDDVESMILLGQIYQKLKQIPEALMRLQKAVRLEPSNLSAQTALGYLYLETNQAQEALKQFQAVLDYHGDDAHLWFGMAQAYHLAGYTDDEIRAYEKTLALSPNLVAALQNVGNAYFTKEMNDEAISTYQKAVLLEPQNSVLHYNLAVMLAKTQQHQQAVTEFLKAIQFNPQYAEACHGIAISYYQLGEYEFTKIYAQKAKAMGMDIQEILLNPK
ncbi:MAG: tetratricopeptide repeat protein [Phycisphaerae bacterium]|nr:tetratricopeptide repeat protein [Phycisphaerae bacterium]